MTTSAPTVIVSGLRAPAALHACRALDAAGYQVVGTDSFVWPVGRFSNRLTAYHPHPSPVADPQGFRDRVQQLIEHYRPIAWLPTCEEVFHLAGLALPELSAVLRAPSAPFLIDAHNKHTFGLEARALGQGPEHTHLLLSAQDVDQHRPEARRLVFKPAFSRFASHVLVQPVMKDLDAVLPSNESPWVAQSYIPGEELSCYALAEKGHVLGVTTYKGHHRAGQGASIYFEPMHDDRIVSFVHKYAEHHQWTGQLAFDFRRDGHGKPLAIECNPRATSGIHLWEPNAALGHALMGQDADLSLARDIPMVGMAMATMGLATAAQHRQVRTWLRDWRRGTDVVAMPSDRMPAAGQVLALLELAGHAFSNRRTLLEASTADIEWNHTLR